MSEEQIRSVLRGIPYHRLKEKLKCCRANVVTQEMKDGKKCERNFNQRWKFSFYQKKKRGEKLNDEFN